MKFKTVEQDIRPILKENYATRCDDMALYACYVFEKVQHLRLGKGWLQQVFSDRRMRIMCGIAPYETVSRCRRKLQEKDDSLRAPEDLRKERKEIEKKYKEYAKGADV